MEKTRPIRVGNYTLCVEKMARGRGNKKKKKKKANESRLKIAINRGRVKFGSDICNVKHKFHHLVSRWINRNELPRCRATTTARPLLPFRLYADPQICKIHISNDTRDSICASCSRNRN